MGKEKTPQERTKIPDDIWENLETHEEIIVNKRELKREIQKYLETMDNQELSAEKRHIYLSKLKDHLDEIEKYHQLQCVGSIVDTIPDDILGSEDRYLIFEERVKSQLKAMNFIDGELADELGVSSEMISEAISKTNRKGTKSYSINKYYLKALSLFLKVSPNYLVGMTEDPGLYFKERREPCNGGKDEVPSRIQVKIPMSFVDEPIIDTVSYIKRNLYGSKALAGLNKRHLVFSYIIICDAKREHRMRMKQTLLSLPAVKRIREKKISYPTREERERENMILWGDTITIGYKISPLQFALTKLGQKDYELLELMAQLLTADSALQNLIYLLLTDGGFTQPKVSFFNYLPRSVDSDGLLDISAKESNEITNQMLHPL